VRIFLKLRLLAQGVRFDCSLLSSLDCSPCHIHAQSLLAHVLTVYTDLNATSTQGKTPRSSGERPLTFQADVWSSSYAKTVRRSHQGRHMMESGAGKPVEQRPYEGTRPARLNSATCACCSQDWPVYQLACILSSPVASSFYGRGDQSRAPRRSFLLEYEGRHIHADTRQPVVVHVHLLPLSQRPGREESSFNAYSIPVFSPTRHRR
jgi:hypothetical protein